MAAIDITISGVLYDKLNRTTQQVVLIGEATYTGLGIGGGPIIPPDKPPVPPGTGIWPNPPEGIAPLPEHPIVLPPKPIPPDPPTGQPDDDGFIKPPPAEGGWGYHEDYGWGYYPKPGQATPKK